LLNEGSLSDSPSSPEARPSALLELGKKTMGYVQKKELGQLMLGDVIFYDSATPHTVV